ncbi:hypothetical protein HK101_002322 [Irineochytrium annulatum]|nr:hypothetical protein HK101_002322 [Irineochytrium annulatum]
MRRTPSQTALGNLVASSQEALASATHSLASNLSMSIESITKSTQVGAETAVATGRGFTGRIASGVMTGIHGSAYATKAGVGKMRAGAGALTGLWRRRATKTVRADGVAADAPAVEGVPEVQLDADGVEIDHPDEVVLMDGMSAVSLRDEEKALEEVVGAPETVRDDSSSDAMATLHDEDEILARFDAIAAAVADETIE